MLFSKPSYNAIGEPFKVAAIQSLGGGKNPHEVGGHDRTFFPYGNQKTKAPKKAAVEWMPEGGKPKDPKRCRDEDGAVMI